MKTQLLSRTARALVFSILLTLFTLPSSSGFASGPTITGASPSSGNAFVSQSITVTGSGFTGATQVLIGKTTVGYNVNSDTSMTVYVPTSTTFGAADITITTPSGTSALVGGYTYLTPPPPTITSLSLTSGYATGGYAVTINGTNLMGAYSFLIGCNFCAGFTGVQFGSTYVGSSISLSSTQITFMVPSSPTLGAVPITVWNGASSVTLNNGFTYLKPLSPHISSISPATGSAAGGTSVTITGSGLMAVNSVSFGAATVSVNPLSDGSFTFNAPASAVIGPVDVKVLTYWDSATAVSAFTYTTPPPPAISSVSPNSGSALSNQAITISGSGFQSVTQVLIGTTPVGYSLGSDSVITLNVPNSSTLGAVDVKVVTRWDSATATGAYTYLAPPKPVISAISPSSGTVYGGGSFAISGSGFTGVNAVQIGGIFASFNHNTDGGLIVYPPFVSTPGTVDITLYTPFDSTTATSAYTISKPPHPNITSLSVSSGTAGGGNVVTINGTNLSAPRGYTQQPVGQFVNNLPYFAFFNYISFGSTTALVNSYSDTQLSVVVPASQTLGTVDVTVGNYWDSSTVTAAYTYVAPPKPVISAVTPNSGSVFGGNNFSISGSGLNSVTQVKLGNTFVSFSHNTDSGLIIPPIPNPSASPGAVDITVITPFDSTTSLAAYTFLAPPQPTITSISVASGSAGGGNIVTISGSNFTTPQGYIQGLPSSFIKNPGFFNRYGYVAFGTSPAAVNSYSDTQIVAVVPASQSLGAVDVTVGNLWESSVLTSAYTYTRPPKLVLSSVSPNTGSTFGNQPITISGTGLSSVSQVQIGGYVSNFSLNSDTSITASTPFNATPGVVDVAVFNTWDSATATAVFTYTIPAAPIITSLDVSSGVQVGGTRVVVTGSGFTSLPNGFMSCVKCNPWTGYISFGNNAAQVTSYTDTQLVAITPANISTGPVDVTVGNYWSNTTLANAFTYVSGPPPLITGLSVTSGSANGGGTLTITGSNFQNVAGYANCLRCSQPGTGYVLFGTTAAQVTQISNTQLSVLIPVGQRLGTVDIVVFNGSGLAVDSGAFTYVSPARPTITSLSVTTGPAMGGTTVTITGTNLYSGYGFTQCNSCGPGYGYILFGNQFANYITSYSATSITFTTPASQTLGAVDVTVGNYWNSVTAPAAFTYTAPPHVTISSISITSGSPRGGDLIVIKGTNFDIPQYGYINCPTCFGYGYVKIGDNFAKVTGNSSIEIDAIIPMSLQAGAVDVVVGNYWNSATSSTRFTYGALPTPPTVSAISPASGSANQYNSITITGRGFLDVNNVEFDGQPVLKFAPISDTEIIVVPPPVALSGAQTVTLTTPWTTVTIPGGFTITGGAPTPPNGEIGVSINDGARYTNSVNVTLSLVWPVGATLATVSNDGGFGSKSSQTFSLQSSISWTINPKAEIPVPDIVYVRFNNDPQTYFDDIIVDSITPILTLASATG